MVPNSQWQGLGLPSPCFEAQDLRDMGRVIESENSPASSMLLATRFPVLFIWEWVSGYIFLILPFLTNIPVEDIAVVLHIP